MNLEKEVARVFNGFLSLNQDQKMKFYGMIRDYQSGNEHAIRELRESVNASVTKMQTGPYRETCSCCGR
jgi:hypothetical protein